MDDAPVIQPTQPTPTQPYQPPAGTGPVESPIAGGPVSTPPPPTEPATAPANTLPPSKTSGVHGVLANVALGALAGAVTGIKKAASAPGKAYNGYMSRTPYGLKVQADRLELQAKQQKMQQEQVAAMDEHQIKQLTLQDMSLDHLHKIAENRHLESMYPGMEEEQRDTLITQHRAQDDADRAFLTHLQEIGIHVNPKQFSEFTPADGKNVGDGTHTVVSNGKTGDEAGGGFISNRELENTILSKDVPVVTDWNMDKSGNMTPVYTTLKSGQNTAMDALLAHDAGMDKFNQLQAMYQTQLKGQEQAAATLQKQKEAAFGPMPKTLGDATAMFTRAQQGYDQNPTDANKQILQNAKQMRQNFLSDDAAKARMEEEAKEAKEGDTGPIAQMLVDRLIAPSQLPGRFRPEYIGKVYKQAQALAGQQGKDFSPAHAEADFNYAKNTQTQNTLNMIEGMDEPGGAIDIAKTAILSLPQMDQKTANKVFNATATEFGSSQATNFHVAMLGLADEYAKVMGGGNATDTGRQQGLDILKDSYSKGQLDEGIDVLRSDIKARKRALVRDNPILKSMYPDLPSQNPQVPQGKVPAYSKSTGKIIGYADDANGTNFKRF